MQHHAEVFRGRPGGSDWVQWLERTIYAFVRHEEKRWGPLPSWDRDDVMQEVNYRLLREWGDHYPQRIEELRDREEGPGDDSGGYEHGPDYQFVVGVINRAIARPRWTVDKRRRRGLPALVPITGDVEEAPSRDTPETIDLAIDICRYMDGMSPVEQKIWRGRVEGKTMHELGEELGMDFRRVSEIAKAVVAHVALSMQAAESGRACPRFESSRRGRGRTRDSSHQSAGVLDEGLAANPAMKGAAY